jgi:hypothetical protein
VVQITANRRTQDDPEMLSAVPLAVKTVTSCVNEDAVLDLALDETRHICIRVLGLENDREGQPGLDVTLYLDLILILCRCSHTVPSPPGPP